MAVDDASAGGHSTSESVEERLTLWTTLGAGGFATVFAGLLEASGGYRQPVAVKVLHAHVAAEQSDAGDRLRYEGVLLSRLRSRYVPHVYPPRLIDAGLCVCGQPPGKHHEGACPSGTESPTGGRFQPSGARWAQVVELIEGGDLVDVVHAEPGLPMTCAVEAVRQVASALEHAWEQLKVAHRDVKPENVRLSVKHGTALLMDFGIAASIELPRAVQKTEGIHCSPEFVCPERWDLDDPGHKGDVWAVGATLFEALAGHRLFPMDPDAPLHALMKHHVDGRPTRGAFTFMTRAAELGRYLDDVCARYLPDDTPEELRALLRATLAHDPDARPTAQEVARKLRRIGRALAADRPHEPSLEEWIANHDWPPLPVHLSPSGHVQTGPTMQEGTSWEAAVPPRPVEVPTGPAEPVRSGTLDPRAVVAGAVQEPLPPRRRTRGWVLAGAAAAVVVVGGVLLLGGAIGGAALWGVLRPGGEVEPEGVAVADEGAEDADLEPATWEAADAAIEAGAPEGAAAESGVDGGGPTDRTEDSEVPGSDRAGAPLSGRADVVTVELASDPAEALEPERILITEVAPAPASRGGFRPLGAVQAVQLRSNGGLTYAPGDDVPPGTYRIFVDFGDGFQPATRSVSADETVADTGAYATIREGRILGVRCRKMLRRCDVDGS